VVVQKEQTAPASLFLEDKLFARGSQEKKSQQQAPIQELTQIQVLTNQVTSLKQIVSTLETSMKRNGSDHELLCEKWRQKVFDTLIEKKRYEIIQQQNLQKYTQNFKTLKCEMEELETKHSVLEAKNLGLEQNNQLLTQQNQEMSQQVAQMQKLLKAAEAKQASSEKTVDVLKSKVSVLLDMVHFEGSLEWSELMQRVGPPLPRRTGGGGLAAWSLRADEAKAAQSSSHTASVGTGQQADNSAQVPAVGVASRGSSISVPAANPAASSTGQVTSASQDRGPLDALRRAAGDLSPERERQTAEQAAVAGLGGSTSVSLPVSQQLNNETEFAADEPPIFISENPALSRPVAASDTAELQVGGVVTDSRFSPVSRQRGVLSPSQVEFPAPAPMTFATGVGIGLTATKLPASAGGYDAAEVREVLPSVPKAIPNSLQSPLSSYPHVSGDSARDFEHAEEREHEALRILRQVESEVRTLKRWYTEAIEAMRSPNPFPPAEGTLT
jgi:hypothetical protein